MTCVNALNVFGLAANLIGVLLLFRYGMPYRVPTGGSSIYVSSSADPYQLAEEQRYKRLGILGLVSIVVGTAAQIVVVLLPSH
jgi:hypothetical protein